MATWLPVPHLLQDKPGWCLPACTAMVAAYWEQALLQADVANWLGVNGVGAPASRIRRLAARGFCSIDGRTYLTYAHDCLAG